MVNAGLIIAYVLIGFSALAAVVMPLIQAASNLGALKKIGLSVGGMIAIFFICYMLAGEGNLGIKDVTASTAKKVGAGIIMFYVLLAGTIGSIIYAEVKKISK